MTIGLDYKDISLISRQISEIDSRDDIDCKEYFPFFDKYFNPIIASPMRDVISKEVILEMEKNDCLSIIDRFRPLEEQIELAKLATYPICSVGVNISVSDFLELSKVCNVFCVDVANSSSRKIKDFITNLNRVSPESVFIVGNVLSKEGITFYEDLDCVIAFRISVGSGSACTTRNTTGIYHPPVSLLFECREVTEKILIADGGIKEPQDYCKAIACGADFVMFGGLIAATKESPAKVIAGDFPFSKKFKVYHGSASYENQLYYKDCPKYIEGTKKYLEYKEENLSSLITRFNEGLKSSMSYANSHNLIEYKENIEVISVIS